MPAESDFIASLRAFASDPAARGLMDDAAVLEVGGTRLVLTHDMIAEGVHFLSDDPPRDVAWKLLAVNLSDLAAKGARPVGALMGYTIGDTDWDRAFAQGLERATAALGCPLMGGDTVSGPARVLGLTAIGEALGGVPSRAGAKAGDLLWVTGSIGDAGAGLKILRGDLKGAADLVERYRLPRPRLEAGQALAPLVSAMMDVSDGLMIDGARMAEASGLALEIEIGSIPLSASYIAALGEDRQARLAAATAGDDYELLFATAEEAAPEILTLSEQLGLSLSRIGRFNPGVGIRLTEGGEDVPLPQSLGYEHRRA
ncbi:MAG TPA: thiamine-phosphate kinase [Allosphingosinicella sp.]|uniref:thiamine-phosphate kinase n=1 Tax=Allosphingosinicella sp. TaxID=2823234 RepID=UPI002ED79AC6